MPERETRFLCWFDRKAGFSYQGVIYFAALIRAEAFVVLSSRFGRDRRSEFWAIDRRLERRARLEALQQPGYQRPKSRPRRRG